MKLSEYDFYLPEKLIAQTPLTSRADSKLLILNENNSIEHTNFSHIIDYLDDGDVLVRNNTKVIPARLFGVKDVTGAKIELLLLKELNSNIWEALVKPAKRIKIGDRVIFGSGLLVATCVDSFDEGIKHFKMEYDGIFLEILDELGTMPLPPYIHEKLDEQDRYQTIYCAVPGSVAAPTAGLHFTQEILDKLEEKNVKIVDVTLNVGLGTFRPVSVEDVNEHKMHSEEYEITDESAKLLNEYKTKNKRIIAVGTTSLRTLEANFTKYNEFKATREETDIFIYPGYKFKAIDALITNFHLPKSTLMMLVSALKTRDIIMDTYKEAIKEEYRFFSFGDSMFINNIRRDDE